MIATLRAYDPAEDYRLVLGSWLGQVRVAPPLCTMTATQCRESFQPLQQALVQRVPPVIAASPHQPGLIYGYACGEMRGELQVLHMVYVKGARRRQGIATQLLENLFRDLGNKTIYITHRTPGERKHRARWKLKFNPYLAQVN